MKLKNYCRGGGKEKEKQEKKASLLDCPELHVCIHETKA
jgi:hypothetical protein